MGNEIIYICNSINNKNVREGELEILEKFEKELYFQFGENQMNIKKRFYNDIETLNKDFEELLKLKKEAKNISVPVENVDNFVDKEATQELVKEEKSDEIENEFKNNSKKVTKIKHLRK